MYFFVSTEPSEKYQTLCVPCLCLRSVTRYKILLKLNEEILPLEKETKMCFPPFVIKTHTGFLTDYVEEDKCYKEGSITLCGLLGKETGENPYKGRVHQHRPAQQAGKD